MRPDPRNDLAFLADMLDYARQIAHRVQDATFADYAANDDFRLATERRIAIVGEAARGVSDAFKAAHPEIPWRPIIAQRHILAHEYGAVIDEKLWRVATEHIPALIALLEPFVPEKDQPSA